MGRRKMSKKRWAAGVFFLVAFAVVIQPCWAAKPAPRPKIATEESLRLAIRDLVATYQSQYPRGREYLARLDALKAAGKAALLLSAIARGAAVFGGREFACYARQSHPSPRPGNASRGRPLGPVQAMAHLYRRCTASVSPAVPGASCPRFPCLHAFLVGPLSFSPLLCSARAPPVADPASHSSAVSLFPILSS